MTREEAAIDDLPRRPPGRILRAAEARAWHDGYGFLAAARREAEQILHAARQEYSREFEAGYQDGKTQGRAEAARLVSETAIRVDRYFRGIEPEVINLALDVVRTVLGKFDPRDLVAKAAEQAVSEFRHAKFLKVSVHPNAANAVRDKLATALHGSDLELTVEINADNTLAIDACVISTEFAVVDASIDAQLKAIAASLTTKAEAQS